VGERRNTHTIVSGKPTSGEVVTQNAEELGAKT